VDGYSRPLTKRVFRTFVQEGQVRAYGKARDSLRNRNHGGLMAAVYAYTKSYVAVLPSKS